MLMTSSFATAQANPANRVSEFKLANGLVVVVVPDTRAPVVTHMVYFRVGSADEPPGVSGIAHFLEHLMFKSTEKLANGEFSAVVSRLGGTHNAFTSYDYTAYFERVAKDRLKDVMAMEADRMVNLQDEGYDLAIRVGVLSDSTLKARRLATDLQVIVASPDYLAAQGVPAAPEDLVRHACLVRGDSFMWSFGHGGRESTVRIAGRLRSNNGEFLRFAALEGQGLLRTSHARVAADIARGRLVRVLDGFELNSESAIWAVYLSSKHVLPKMRVLLDFLVDWFKDPEAVGLVAGKSGLDLRLISGSADVRARMRPAVV